MWIDISDGANQESESIQQEERTALIGQDGTDQRQAKSCKISRFSPLNGVILT